jgi:RNA polymerase sigma factor (sigma-70 family)
MAMTRDEYGKAYRHGFDLTVRFLISRGVPSEPARDAAQAAWVRGWERLSQLRNDSMVVTWVNTIAMNVHRSVLRSERSCQALADHAQTAEMNLAAIDVARILKYCRPRDRVLLELQMQGNTMEEIARKEGVTEAAIRIRLVRARRAARGKAERRVVKTHRLDEAKCTAA